MFHCYFQPRRKTENWLFGLQDIQHWLFSFLWYHNKNPGPKKLKWKIIKQGRWNLVAGYGSCHTNIWEIYYCLPESAIPIFQRFTLSCHTNILELPTALVDTNYIPDSRWKLSKDVLIYPVLQNHSKQEWFYFFELLSAGPLEALKYWYGSLK